MTDKCTKAGMKEDEARSLGNCAVCGKKMLDTPMPLIYVITIERYGADMMAIQRRHGLNLMMGNAALASTFSPDEDLLKCLDGPHRVFVHEACAGDVHHLALLCEADAND